MPASWPSSVDANPAKAYFNQYAWADYVELLALVSPDGLVTEADALDRTRDRKEDLGEGDPAEASEETEEGTEKAAEADDGWERRIETWFEHLAFRARAFGDAYPFEYRPADPDRSVALLRRLAFTDKQRLYLTLLFSANLRYVLAEMPVLTGSFELLSAEVLRRLLPGTARVKLFGAGPPDPLRYTEGQIYKRMGELAVDLHERVTAEPTEFARQATGDEGLDLVGWVPFGDGMAGMPIVFGQCACTEEWVSKQHSSSALTWGSKMSRKCAPINAIFIPHCFRRADGSWHKQSAIVDSVLVDRLRLIHVLDDDLSGVTALGSFAVTDRLIGNREEVV